MRSISAPAARSASRVLRSKRLVDRIDDVRRRFACHIGVMDPVRQSSTNLLDGLARADVGVADQEDASVDALEPMVAHQPLHLAIIAPAPILAREEGRADLYLARLGTLEIVTRTPDHRARRAVYRDQHSARGETVGEEFTEHRLLPAVVRGVHFPDQRVARDREQSIEIVGRRRAERDGQPNQGRDEQPDRRQQRENLERDERPMVMVGVVWRRRRPCGVDRRRRGRARRGRFLLLVDARDPVHPGGRRRGALVLPTEYLDEPAEGVTQDRGGQEDADIMMPATKVAERGAVHESRLWQRHTRAQALRNAGGVPSRSPLFMSFDALTLYEMTISASRAPGIRMPAASPPALIRNSASIVRPMNCSNVLPPTLVSPVTPSNSTTASLPCQR